MASRLASEIGNRGSGKITGISQLSSIKKISLVHMDGVDYKAKLEADWLTKFPTQLPRPTQSMHGTGKPLNC